MYILVPLVVVGTPRRRPVTVARIFGKANLPIENTLNGKRPRLVHGPRAGPGHAGSAHASGRRGPSHSACQCTPLAKVASSEFEEDSEEAARRWPRCWLAGQPEAEDPLPGALAVTRSLGFGPSGSLLGSVGYYRD